MFWFGAIVGFVSCLILGVILVWLGANGVMDRLIDNIFKIFK